MFAQRYYNRAVRDGLELELEKEKVAYYNMYAERKQNEILAREADTKDKITSLRQFLLALIPEVDALQRDSRFAQNQLIISERLTKIGLSLRLALRKYDNEQQSSTSPPAASNS
jgi:hypothetical protein